MDINNAVGAGPQACLNQGVILSKVGLVEGSSGDVVGQELPPDVKAEEVVFVVLHKVGHLTSTIGTVVLDQGGVRAACRA